MLGGMMESVKIVSWNLEWSNTLLTDLDRLDGPAKQKATVRLAAISREIEEIGADILAITEGPSGEERATRFFSQSAPGYRLVIHGDPTGKAYRTQGFQWIWFLVREGVPINSKLMNLDRWVQLTAQASLDQNMGKWKVALPKFTESDGSLLLEPEKTHKHYRHPQVLLVEVDGFRFEIVAAHLKSKRVNTATPPGPGQDGFFRDNPAFVAEIVTARAKLTSEASDVRYFIDGRFKEDGNVPIVLLGDFNDGPGKELVEEQFLLHDLISNLQGEVFFARRFLNHALFDFDDAQRWTVEFEDKLDPRRPREILLDHILFTQSFVGDYKAGMAPFEVKPRSGKVEHAVHHAVNSTVSKGSQTSDHRPVSVTLTKRTGIV
jgi:hypothetical protein